MEEGEGTGEEESYASNLVEEAAASVLLLLGIFFV